LSWTTPFFTPFVSASRQIFTASARFVAIGFSQ
jgi:hypothetical protein